MFKLKISKLYDTDVDSCYDYINYTLKNPKAAYNLISEIKNILKEKTVEEMMGDD